MNNILLFCLTEHCEEIPRQATIDREEQQSISAVNNGLIIDSGTFLINLY